MNTKAILSFDCEGMENLKEKLTTLKNGIM